MDDNDKKLAAQREAFANSFTRQAGQTFAATLHPEADVAGLAKIAKLLFPPNPLERE